MIHPELEPWDFEQYARLLRAGLRSGEVKALRWREDVDLTAKTITVNQQT